MVVANVHDLMNATGTTAINIEPEYLRLERDYQTVPVVTHTMQANGNSYGDGPRLGTLRNTERVPDTIHWCQINAR